MFFFTERLGLKLNGLIALPFLSSSFVDIFCVEFVVIVETVVSVF